MKKQVFLLLIFSLVSALAWARTAPAINVMSYNILCDEGPRWDARIGQLTGQMKFYDCDVIGMQEVRYNQLTDIARLLPEYTHVGVGRTDGAAKGEFCAVFFKTDRFRLIDSGTFWLAEDVTAVGQKGWDAAYERVATWVILKDKLSGKKFFFMNTHLDHMGQVARRESARLLLRKTAELAKGLPAMITGDFNATADEEPIRILLNPDDKDHFTDSRKVAGLVYGPAWSFQDMGSIPYADRVMIDYLFIKGNVSVLKEGVLAETFDGRYVSDHCPVFATVRLP